MKHLIAIIFLIALAGSVDAQSLGCLPRTALVDALENRHGELQHSVGMSGQTKLIEVWVNPTTKSFTIITSDAQGVSCIILAGRNWVDIETVDKGDEM